MGNIFPSEYLSLANPGGENKTQELGVTALILFGSLSGKLNFYRCGPPFRRCCTAATETGNTLETANQGPGDATVQEPPKEDSKIKE